MTQPRSRPASLGDRLGVRRIVDEAQSLLADNTSLGDLDQILDELGGDDSSLTEADIEELTRLTELAASVGADEPVAAELLRRDGMFRLSVTDDGMSVLGRFEPPRAGGKPVTVEQIVEMMRSQRLDRGIQVDEIRAAVNAAANGQVAEHVVVARGQAPVAGKPATYELYVRDGIDAQPQRIELREPTCELDHPMLCREGDLVLRRRPAEPGRPGFDVFGTPLKPPVVGQLPIMAGRHVRTEGDVFFAQTAGQVVLQAGHLEVRRVLTLTEDVTRPQGPVQFDGDIHIRAAVRSGAVVRATGSIVVDGAVEDAELESSGGDIVLRHGVAGRQRAKIVAAGDVTTRFAENVSIIAQRDLTVQNGALHSRLVAGRQMSIVAGRGQLIGGVAMAGERLEARQIGAPSGVKTEVRVGLDRQAMTRLADVENTLAVLTQRLEQTRDLVQRIERTVGDPARLPREDRETFLQLRKTSLVCDIRLRQAHEQRDQMLAGCAASVSGTVDVAYALMPGVTVSIGSAAFQADEPLRRVRLQFDPESGKVKVRPL